jgi:hypothetical protein
MTLPRRRIGVCVVFELVTIVTRSWQPWPAYGVLCEDLLVDYLPESTGISEPLPVTEPRLGRRTVLTFPLLPPPQKN